MDKQNSITGGAGHPDPYAYLFEFQPADRPALSERETLAKIALLKFNQPDRYEKLIGVLKEKRVPRLRELEQDVSRTLRKLEDIRHERKAQQHENHDDGFERDAKTGAVLPTQGNIRIAIAKLDVALRFDAFARRPIIDGLDGFGPTLDDNAETRLWLEIDERFRFRARKDFFHAVVFDICLANQFHPVRDYLDGLTWDGTARLDTWLSDYCGVEDTPYTRAVGRITLIAAVRRVRQPGCKFDEMLVLESPEGFNKSTMLAEMAVSEEWFSDSLPLNVDDKRMIENASGKWIIENAELQGMRKGDFSGRADVAAYLPFALHPLLADGGKLGIIITNAWLGTDWGDDFYNRLSRYYHLESVVTSGAGRWFTSSDVITNILILRRKADPDEASPDVKFVVLTRPLEEMADDDAVQIAAAQIELGQTQQDTMTIRSVSHDALHEFRRFGLGGNAQFVNCDWVIGLPLVPLRNLFEIRRGERRGMNELFYPPEGHGIEAEYIRPLAKSPAALIRLRGPATKVAFSCSRSIEELNDLGHTGARNWIARFDTPENVAKLSKAGMHWYEMRADTLTDLVMFINYGSRLFIGRIDPPAFADQRFVRLDPLGEVDLDLCHALLNSTVSMFFIEGMGFGRGLGALDLNKDRIEEYMHLLDPDVLDDDAAQRVKDAFAPLLVRDVLSVADELDQADRQAFDDVVIEEFALGIDRQHVYDALLALVEIRQTATE